MARRSKAPTGTTKKSKTRKKILRPVEALLATKAKNTGGSNPSPNPQQADKPVENQPSSEASKSDTPQAKPAEPPPAAASEPAKADAPAAKEDAPAAKEEAEPEFAELIPPRFLPKTKPDASAPPPGLAPRGDARSFRRSRGDEGEFCLIYRAHRQLIVRRGTIGKYGQVEVVDYPSERSAAHAYAQKCSEITGEGFFDLRE